MTVTACETPWEKLLRAVLYTFRITIIKPRVSYLHSSVLHKTNYYLNDEKNDPLQAGGRIPGSYKSSVLSLGATCYVNLEIWWMKRRSGNGVSDGKWLQFFTVRVFEQWCYLGVSNTVGSISGISWMSLLSSFQLLKGETRARLKWIVSALESLCPSSCKLLFLPQSVPQLFLLGDAIFLSLEHTPNWTEVSAVILVLFLGVNHCCQRNLVSHLDEGRVTESLVFLYSDLLWLVWTEYLMIVFFTWSQISLTLF